AGEVRGEGDWGSYPTRTLRVLLSAAVLARLGVGPADESVAAGWLRTYSARPLREYESDAGPVASAVLDGPYGMLDGAGLTTIVRYTNDDEQTISRLAGWLLAGVEIGAADVRHISAAVRLAYDRDRDKYELSDAATIARDKIASIPWDGVRAAGGADTLPEAVRSDRDRRAGRALSELMGRAAGRDENGRS